MKIAISVYLLSMTAANLLVAQFGPVISPILAFFLIGLDLTLRDVLHVRLKASFMIGLILCAGCLTLMLNSTAGMVAVASASAFTLAALTDWAVFCKVEGSWLKRSNASNVAGAAVDSIVFPTIAFGALMPHIVATQFIAKVAGGTVWSWILRRSIEQRV